MSIQTVQSGEFQTILDEQRVAVIEFGASWCPPCKTLEPILEHLSDSYGERIKVVKIDCDESPQLAGQYGVMSMPTVFILKDGVPIDKLVGLRPPAVYKSLIDRVLAE